MLLVLVLTMMLGASLASATTEEEGVVLRVGLDQPWTTLNVTAGFEVSVYEIWNLQYATLTDKSADDSRQSRDSLNHGMSPTTD
ncbi:MAG: hypothetical protein ABR609_04925 [Acidimicrobiia bacterium]